MSAESDLQFEGCSVQPGSIGPGDTAQFSATYRNIGFTPIQMGVIWYLDGTDVISQTAEIGPGLAETLTNSASWDYIKNDVVGSPGDASVAVEVIEASYV